MRIPMLPGTRSLNLSNSVAIVVYEALRQKRIFQYGTDRTSEKLRLGLSRRGNVTMKKRLLPTMSKRIVCMLLALVVGSSTCIALRSQRGDAESDRSDQKGKGRRRKSEE